MGLKPAYRIHGAIWLPLARAARLIGTNVAGVRKLMGDGTLDWCQRRPGSTTSRVEQAGVLRLRAERGRVAAESAARRAAPRPRSDPALRPYRHVAPDPAAPTPRGPGVFDRTWDPSPGPRSSRTKV